MDRCLVPRIASVVLAATAHAATVDLYGHPDSFGTLCQVGACQIPTQQSLSLHPVSNWQIDPGQTFLFPALTSDGTLLIGNITQTMNQYFSASCTMGVTCFNPDAQVCSDSDAPGADHFGTIRIPTNAGASQLPAAGCESLQGACTNGVCTSGYVDSPCSKDLDCEVRPGGADVGDVAVVPGAEGERVIMNSALGSLAGLYSADTFPAFGALSEEGGAWSVDALSLRTPLQLSQSDPTLGPIACPNGDCKALAETAHLPASGRVVMTHYFGGISILEADGTILAHYSVPQVPDPCDTATPPVNMISAPREIDVDPTGTLGNERFVVVYDMYSTGHQVSQPTQEFRYDDGARSLVPVSAPIFPYTQGQPATPTSGPSCGAPVQVTIAQYDHRGNLWFARSTVLPNGAVQGPILVMLEDPVTGKRRMETDCSFLDASGQPRPWGSHCLADLETGVASVTSGVPSWKLNPWTVSLVEDAATGTMFAIQSDGQVAMVERLPTSQSDSLTLRPPMILGLGKLRPGNGVCTGGTADGSWCNNANPWICGPQGQCLADSRGPTRGILDAPRRALWIPIATVEPIAPKLCGFFECQFEVGELRDAWLYRIQIDHARLFGVRASAVDSPSRVISGAAFEISITANITAPLNANSFLSVYLNGSASRVVPDLAWTTTCVSGGECTFTAVVPASVTAGGSGSLAWHGFLGTAANGSLLVHSTGRVAIDLDGDGDGVGDPVDNCSQTPNTNQIDTNADGFGNRCDADYDNNGMVGASDYGRLAAAYGTTTEMPGFDPAIDVNNDGAIGAAEFSFFVSRFGLPPGPSGLACAGTIPCPVP
jgi:hypothetical protein